MPIKIQIETVTPEQVKKLEAENVQLRDELDRLRLQHNSLHETVYRFMDNFVEFKRSIKDRH